MSFAPPPGYQPPPPVPVPTPPTRGLRPWVVALVITGVLAVGGSIAAIVVKGNEKRGVTHQEEKLAAQVSSKAIDHLPRGCDVAIRVDVAKILALKPAEERLAPVLNDVAMGTGAPSPKTRELLRAAGVDVRKDVTELGVCASALGEGIRGQRLTIVIAGMLRPGAALRAIAPNDKQELPDHKGHKVVKTLGASKQPLFVGQADDGAIVITNDEAALDALDATGNGAYELATDAELSFAISEELWKPGSSVIEGPMARHAAYLVNAAGAFRPKKGAGQIRVTLKDPTRASDFDATLKELMAKAATLPDAADGGPSLLKTTLAGTTLTTDGANERIDVKIDPATLDAVIDGIAKGLKDANAKGALAL